MAVTKTHPIKSTLKAAIDYILNPEKTDGKLLASSFGCGLETADIEFAWTREAAGDRGTHLGRHLIQSFAVGETTPEEAHKIGMELAGAVLGGKYEFVLTTHVDKDHLHNHLIFNAVSFVDYKKYHSNKQSYHFIRRTSDRICKEHLSDRTYLPPSDMLPVWKGCPVARSDRKFDVPESAFDEAPGWRAFLLVSWFPDVPRHRNCRMDSGSRHKPVRHENAFHIQRMHLLILLFRRSKGSG